MCVLSGLTELWQLDLASTQVSDVAPLAGLKNLIKLFLKDSKVTDFSPLAGIYDQLEEKDFVLK